MKKRHGSPENGDHDADTVEAFDQITQAGNGMGHLSDAQSRSVPEVTVDGWEVEHVEGEMLHLAFYTEHTRDDGEIIRDFKARMIIDREIWETALLRCTMPDESASISMN